MLQDQKKVTPSADTVIKPAISKPHDTITRIISHSMNVKIGRYGVDIAKKSIKLQ